MMVEKGAYFCMYVEQKKIRVPVYFVLGIQLGLLASLRLQFTWRNSDEK